MSAGNALLLALMLASGAQAKNADEQCKAYTVLREAGGESKRSRRAVLDVLQNRMHKKHKSCSAVVSEPHQFPWWSRRIHMKVSKEHLQDFRSVARMKPVLTTKHTNFFKKNLQPPWSLSLNCSLVIGGHRFCKNPKY